ncbi:Calcium-binding allergen Bet v 3 [Hibiscus syriacus]|uniref:Calcium-binding allergen Bet v 3 n=1 Tax=Hibiscus syriacus TaxID=106335 RepID=A0A6A2Z1Q3_HIBSY|nr:Calcium-binding allergen Bet v 3 [Hibiscus syriacus]
MVVTHYRASTCVAFIMAAELLEASTPRWRGTRGNGGWDVSLGIFTYDGFVALHRSLDETFFGLDKEEEEDESDLTEAFKVFDEDGDGFISAKELQAVLWKLGLPEGKDIGRVEQMICSVDQNHDGRVDFFEFKHMMQGVVVRSS